MMTSTRVTLALASTRVTLALASTRVTLALASTRVTLAWSVQMLRELDAMRKQVAGNSSPRTCCAVHIMP